MKKNLLSFIVSVLAAVLIVRGSMYLGTIGVFLLYYLEGTWIYPGILFNHIEFLIPIISGGLPALIAGLLLARFKAALNWKVVVSLPLIFAVPAAGLHVFGYFYDEIPLSFDATLGLVIGSLLMPGMLVVYLRPETDE